MSLPSDEYLIRTSSNCLLGPFGKEHVLGMIDKGELTLQDEVCLGTGYWIYLHETEEVFKLLGINMSQASRGDAREEVTETDTDILVSATGGRGSNDSDPLPELMPDLDEQPEGEQEDFDREEQTTALKRPVKQASSRVIPVNNLRSHVAERVQLEPAQQAKVVAPPQGPPTASNGHPKVVRPEVQILGSVEKPSLWRGLFFILLLGSGALLVILLRRLT